MGRGSFAPLAHANFAARMLALRFAGMSGQGNPIAALAGAVVALTEEVDALERRIVELENRQSGTFTKV